MSVEEILNQVKSLTPEDQERVAAVLAREVLSRSLSRIASKTIHTLPIDESEIDRIVRETRREIAGARHP
ncbi:MAG: hypothetical protein IPK83_02195 [Planctomycetes bacterium]|nr:hypothetical protein [Planctomycetota bacterium]